GSFIMPEVVPADEFACRRMSRDLGHHARDAVAVELDRAECLGRGLVEFAGQLEGQPCSVEAAYSWGADRPGSSRGQHGGRAALARSTAPTLRASGRVRHRQASWPE